MTEQKEEKKKSSEIKDKSTFSSKEIEIADSKSTQKEIVSEDLPIRIEVKHNPDNTIAQKTPEKWFEENKEMLANLDPYHQVVTFCQAFGINPVLRSEFHVIDPQRRPLVIANLLLSKRH